MAKIVAVADCHVGNHKQDGGAVEAGLNQRCRFHLTALRAAADLAEQQGATLLINGDLYDYCRPEPQVEAAVQEAIQRVPTIVLVGNHDQVSTTPGDHALGPLGPIAEVIDTPRRLEVGDVELLAVPFQPGAAKNWLPQAVASIVGEPLPGGRMLAIHLGVSDERTPYFLDGSPDSISVKALDKICDEHGIDLVVAGNWHRRRKWKRGGHQIIQCGTLSPNRATDAGDDDVGLAHVIELNAHKVVTVEKAMPGPRFLVATSMEELHAHSVNADERTIICARVLAQDYQAALELAAKSRAYAVRIDADDGEAVAAARTAASAARAATTFDQALADYVGEMSLAEGVDRGDVLARCQQYLKRV